MGESVSYDKWIFLCPVHGEESSLFCFKAFDKKNASRWRKVHVIAEEVETTLEERQEYQRNYSKRMGK